MRQARQFRAAQFLCRELQSLRDTYGIPASVMSLLPDYSSFQLMETDWFTNFQNVVGDELANTLARRLKGLHSDIRSERREITRWKHYCFENVARDAASRARSHLRHNLGMNEGMHFNMQGVVHFAHHMHEAGYDRTDLKVTIGTYSTVWHRGKKVPHWDVLVVCSPKTALSVDHNWAGFKIKGKNQVVLKADEMKDHAFNDQGVTVYKLKCFGLVDDEPREYDYMLCENKTMRGEDGNPLYAHGKDASTALSLLNRRIKSETIKRLDI